MTGWDRQSEDPAVPFPPTRPPFVRYPAYRRSGIAWLDEIPAHWELGRLRRTVSKCQNGVWGEDADGTNDVACIRVADFDRSAFSVDVSSLTLRHVNSRALATHRLKPGDLLLEKSGGGDRHPVGAVVIFTDDLPAVCSNFIARMPVSDGYSPVFLVYLHAALYSSRINVRSIKQSIGIQNLDSDSYLNQAVGFPPLDEQCKIATFLDREIAEIDALIAKPQELIRLLQEKRTALISHAVTKGLNADAAMKESGVEWLREIPAHWEVRRAKEGYREIDRRSKAGSEMLLGLTKSRGVVPRSEIAQRASVARSYTGYKRCAVGDLVVNKLQAWNGVLGVSRHEGIVSPDYTVMRTIDRGWSTEYNAYLFRTPMYVSAFASRSKGIGLGFMRLYSRDFGLVETIIPPLPEQRAIVRHLDRETAKIDALVAKAKDAIAHLNEYRTALISAAVTGQIDVRGHNYKSTCEHARYPQLDATHHTPSHRHRRSPR